MFQVVKRDGEIAQFNLKKISAAITKAFDATNKMYHSDIIDLLALRVTSDFQSKVKEGAVNVEDIQDSVEHTLEQSGYTDVAKAYILYRKNREKLRNMKSTILDYKEIVDSYVREEDWRVKENSTVTYSVGGLILHNSGSITAHYWLSEIYDAEIAAAHRGADIHIHDLSMLTGYCAGWSLKQLIKEGLGGIPGKITSAPAKHLS
ncbi:MAG: ribonucleoside triphosphate reductase, partial [Lachnospiraceae bacterium]|nr:ribonucleoside triphosphate reductase [Lachnospiraceae bacterium]